MSIPYLSNREIISSKNRARMHTPFGAYENMEQAKAQEKEKSKYYINLNGRWKYTVYASPEEVPEGWSYPGELLEEMAEMTIPSCQEINGIDKPVYTNVQYPFNRNGADRSFEVELTQDNYELNAPDIPKDNLTVCYYRNFQVPDIWDGRKIYLNFGGVETAFLLCVNGKEVGYSEDSKLDAEFDITDFVKQGENLLAVQVFKYSPQSYLEDQDYWHLHGIYRDVELYSKNPLHIADYQVQTLFGETLKDAKLHVRIWPETGIALYGTCSARITLFSESGEQVMVFQTKNVSEYCAYLHAKYVIEETIPVSAPKLWDCEKPYLYTFVVELLDGQGNQVDIESSRIGFREVRIDQGVLQLNRRRLIVRGANLHEHSAYTGRSVTEKELMNQLLKLKELNFNAVRTCHYPKSSRFYDLCDQLGLYVVDEANIETHGYGGGLSDHPAWTDAYMQRGARMCLRDKNHPCVIIWSLGNESGVGANHAALYGWLKFYDNRPVQYESGGSLIGTSDIIAPMYPNREWIEECMASGDERPFIMCEYAYAKGNSNGNFAEYWEFIRKYPRFQGGFLWDFIDKAIAQKGDEAVIRFRYAGAFGEDIKDSVPDMCLNGILFADLSQKPAAEEIKVCQAPLYLKYNSWHGMFGAYYLHNECFDSDLSELEFGWELLNNGECVQKGILDNISVPPGEAVPITLPYDPALVQGESFWNLYARLKEDCFYAKVGHLVYKIQLAAEGSQVYCEDTDLWSDQPLNVSEDETYIDITGDGLQIIYNKQEARLWLCRIEEKELFSNVKNRFMRAPTGIDEGCSDNNCYFADWKRESLDNPDFIVQKIRWRSAVNIVFLEEKLSFCNGRLKLERDYQISTKGIRMITRVANSVMTDTLPRIGQSFELPNSFEKLSWYGRGPQENYADRKSCAFVGIYTDTVQSQHIPYVRPCECGGKEDVRWLEIKDAEGRGMRITGSNLFHFSALPWTLEQYLHANYQEELGESKGVSLTVDGKHAGLGGDTGWTRNIHPEYRIPAGNYFYELKLQWIG
ncbi:MAG: DUF4981 domain-containing protein [Acetatifactor sp.]|nr:DUF4981 domain-containing protein [Acetatifactor sp.]